MATPNIAHPVEGFRLFSLSETATVLRRELGHLLRKSPRAGFSIRESSDEVRLELSQDVLRMIRVELEPEERRFSIRKPGSRDAFHVLLTGVEADVVASERRLVFVFTKRPPESVLAGLFSYKDDASREEAAAVQRVVEAGSTDLRRIFLTRALNAVADLGRTVDERRLAEAAAAPGAYATLVRALESREVVEDLRQSDPLAPARLRGVDARRQLIDAAGGLLSAQDVGELLTLSRQAVDKRRKAGRLLAVPQGRRGYGYPTCQFSNGQVIPGLESVFEALVDHDPWMRLVFLVNPNSDLDERMPLDVLRTGPLDRVLRAARAFGEHGAA